MYGEQNSYHTPYAHNRSVANAVSNFVLVDAQNLVGQIWSKNMTKGYSLEYMIPKYLVGSINYACNVCIDVLHAAFHNIMVITRVSIHTKLKESTSISIGL